MSLEDQLSRVRNLFGKPADIHRLIARADSARDRKEWAEAAQLYAEVLGVDPSLAHLWIQLGHALKEQGQLAEAETAYRKSLLLDDRVADAHLQLGHALKVTGRLDGAREAYFQALVCDQGCSDAVAELVSLGLSPRDIRGRLELIRPHKEERKAGETDQAQIVFDVSDLIQYFQNARLPTGIQRVQINMINALLGQDRDDLEIGIVFFDEYGEGWFPVSHDLFRELSKLSVLDGQTDDPQWERLLDRVRLITLTGVPYHFRPGASLVNLGTSWWLQNYFLYIRELKDRCGLRYYPFVHDLIPVLTPEHCVKGLTQDFISWIVGVFDHADGFYANSESTAKDLARVARLLGYSEPDATIIRLDGAFDRPTKRADRTSQLVETWRKLHRGPYVLFVGTIESRKNHLLAFSAWLSMIRSRGLERTPKLVCVGNHGWLVDAAMAKLNSSEVLRQKVELLSKISDTELDELYRDCLFTVCPSHYEGWGLPVTESLCYGKVPLLANSSSLPEAGGEFAEYFDVRSERDFEQKLVRLIDDHEYRKSRERKIKQEFRPRPWAEIARQLIQPIRTSTTFSGERDLLAQKTFEVKLGQYYQLTRNRELTIWKGMINGEVFRTGAGWWAPDDRLCWIKPEGGQLKMRMPDTQDGPLLLYLLLEGLPAESGKTANAEIDVVDGPAWAIRIGAGERPAIKLALDPAPDRILQVKLTATASFELAKITEGQDRRVVSMGLRGFLLCSEGDLAARVRLLEALQLQNLGSLSVPDRSLIRVR